MGPSGFEGQINTAGSTFLDLNCRVNFLELDMRAIYTTLAVEFAFGVCMICVTPKMCMDHSVLSVKSRNALATLTLKEQVCEC